MTPAIIVRYHFAEPDPARSNELNHLLKQTYGTAMTILAEGTLFIDSFENPEEVFENLSQFFNFDDRLFVGRISDFESLHQITRLSPRFAV